MNQTPDTTNHTTILSDEWLRERIAVEERVQAIQAERLARMREELARRERELKSLNRWFVGKRLMTIVEPTPEDELVMTAMREHYERSELQNDSLGLYASFERAIRRAMRQAVALHERATAQG